eukprot:maker-scaffold_27-snap-gene-0.32-mRNA-1 protein AED:0.01 eAED:0.01 QI:92/1/1/1/1/1/3/58/275
MENLIEDSKWNKARTQSFSRARSFSSFVLDDNEISFLHARAVAWASIGVTIILSSIGLVVQQETESASTLANSLDSLIDVFTSILLLWRFWNKNTPLEVIERREQKSQVFISFTFILLCGMVSYTAYKHLKEREEVVRQYLVLSLAIPSFLIQLLLGALKIKVAEAPRVNSIALKNDGISSMMGSLLSAGIILDVLLMNFDRRIWYIDAVFAILVAFILLCFSINALITLKSGWWRYSFWCRSSDGDIFEKLGSRKDSEETDLGKKVFNPALDLT